MEIKILFLIMLITLSPVISEEYYNYCRIPTCDPDTHTLCKFNTSYVAAKCNQQYRSSLTDPEKNLIINLHNHFRDLVYNGHELRGLGGPQPEAKAVVHLEWDDELQEAAQAWAQQCQYVVDDCRNVERFLVNQLVISNITDGDIEEIIIDNLLWSWYNEVQRFNTTNIERYDENIAARYQTYHYTQLVWEKTTKFGCATMRYRDAVDLFSIFTLVCNYGPKGNIHGEPVYTIKKGTFNSSFMPNLFFVP